MKTRVVDRELLHVINSKGIKIQKTLCKEYKFKVAIAV
jgi:hypothetical protein